ncbi:hypothetical protein BH20CHL6_BH20CHL6_07290 [soil metagenome]
MQQVRTGGPPPRLIALLLSIALTAIVALALLPRLSGHPLPVLQATLLASPILNTPPPSDPPSSASPSPVAFTLDTLPFPHASILLPRRDAEIDGSLPIVVSGRGTGDLSNVRAVIVADGRELGRAFVSSDPSGYFRAAMPIYPPPTDAAAQLLLYDAPTGYYLLAQPITLRATSPVALWSPGRPGTVFDPGLLAVSGRTLASIERIRVEILDAEGRVLARQAADTTSAFGQWRTFSVELELPLEPPSPDAILRVTWRDPVTSERAPGIELPIKLRGVPFR